ncbi:acyl-CoA dehydrogenase family protein [Sphingopyxis kveilinensis]|uniref:acyl-CoA dehydrogenase family protein n=1 Tax=Sphingopyxis kveilinensis TaxID=3114367 RepID=UPI0030D12EF9
MYRSPWVDDELQMMRDQIGKLVRKEFAPRADGWTEAGKVDRATWQEAGRAGLLCASVPECYGGGGGNDLHEIAVIEELYGNDVGDFAAGVMVSSLIVAHYILRYGTEEQRMRWLPRLATGELIGAIAMTEPHAGSDLQGIRTRAVRVDGGFRLSGQKTFITNGQNAELILVVAKCEIDGGKDAVSLFAVETEDAEGFERGRNLDKIGQHGQDTSELFFDAVLVPQANLLGGTPGHGLAQLMQQLPWERLAVAVASVVNAERALALTIDYTKQRQAFGKPIFEFQNTQFKLAECKSKVMVGRLFIDQLIEAHAEGRLSNDQAAIAKYWTSEMQGVVIDECLQLYGGYGYMSEYPIARLWKDARASRIYAGTSEIMKLVIARTL